MFLNQRAPSSNMATIRGKVNFDYAAQAANQLSLRKGDIVIILQKGDPGGWSKGQDDSGGWWILQTNLIIMLTTISTFPKANLDIFLLIM